MATALSQKLLCLTSGVQSSAFNPTALLTFEPADSANIGRGICIKWTVTVILRNPDRLTVARSPLQIGEWADHVRKVAEAGISKCRGQP
jgi:hypothetical protein